MHLERTCVNPRQPLRSASVTHLVRLPLHLHGAVLRHLLPAVDVERHVVKQLPQHTVAEAVVVQVQLRAGARVAM